MKTVILRGRATRDVEAALDFYCRSGSEDTASQFIESFQRAMKHLGLHPRSGSLRYASYLELPGLRCWPFRGFPYLVFYFDRTEEVDVWRILHSSQDIPSSLQGTSVH